jgi:hypothetical protein
LNRDDRRKILSMRSRFSSNGVMGEFQRPLGELVEACQALLYTIEEEAGDSLVDYMIAVMDLLEKAHLPQSPRRARSLAHGIIAIHAARRVLEGDEVELADSAELALLYGLPQNATEVPPTPAAIVALHRQAWEIATMLDDEVWRQILAETDPLKRILVGDSLDLEDEEMSRLVTQALNADASEARKVGIATALFLRFSKHRQLSPAAWEPLAKLAGRVMLPRLSSMQVAQNTPDATIWHEIKAYALEQRKETGLPQLLVNYALGGFPELWRQHNWQEAVKQFAEDLKLFAVEDV